MSFKKTSRSFKGKPDLKDKVMIAPLYPAAAIVFASVSHGKYGRLILAVPGPVSKKNKKTLGGLDAKVVWTPAKDGMEGAVKKAKDLASRIPDSHILYRSKTKKAKKES